MKLIASKPHALPYESLLRIVGMMLNEVVMNTEW